MKYRVGDKFLCINNFEDDYDRYSEIIFTEGKYYAITSIDYTSDSESDDSESDDFEIFITGDDNEEYFFTINDIMSPYYLYEYFKELREDRMDKLKKLEKL